MSDPANRITFAYVICTQGGEFGATHNNTCLGLL